MKGKIISNLIFFVLLIIILTAFWNIYQKYNYNDFEKSVYEYGRTDFIRDETEKYTEEPSYKIQNNLYNDAMFYQTIEVKPYHSYRVSCMVKTEEVMNRDDILTGGAQICIRDTTERSISIMGSSDWTKLEFMFNSKDRTTVDIGFRLGGYETTSKGSAWFSELKMEEGSNLKDNKWNFACFFINTIETTVSLDGYKKNVKLSLTQEDKKNMKQNMARFKNSCEELSRNQIKVEYDIIEINTPLTTLSYDDENGYYIGEKDVYPMLEAYLQSKEYDHIFLVVRMGDENKHIEIPVRDWIGLGGMEYFGIGLSNIRMPNSPNSYTYKYDVRINTFPEEVLLHEFLHTLERNAKEYDTKADIPALHDNEKYGYKVEKLTGLKKWYKDYMSKEIILNDGIKIGLEPSVYARKPTHNSDFEISNQLNIFKEPQNIIEEIKSIAKKIAKKIEGNREAIMEN